MRFLKAYSKQAPNAIANLREEASKKQRAGMQLKLIAKNWAQHFSTTSMDHSHR